MKLTISPSGKEQVCTGRMVEIVITVGNKSSLESVCDKCGRLSHNEPLNLGGENVILDSSSHDDFIGHVGSTKH
jgi:hypothetical protein